MISSSRFNPNEIRMGNEFYSIEVVIEVAETAENFRKGNIYI
jgi:hypothetical protein